MEVGASNYGERRGLESWISLLGSRGRAMSRPALEGGTNEKKKIFT